MMASEINSSTESHHHNNQLLLPSSTPAWSSSNCSPPAVVTATSITELLNSHVATQASSSGSTPSTSSSASSANNSNTMNTVAAGNMADVAASPCTSAGGGNNTNGTQLPGNGKTYRSSPYPDCGGGSVGGKMTTAGNSNSTGNMLSFPSSGRSSTTSNGQTPVYHHNNQFYQQQQHDSNGPASSLVNVRGKTDPAMAPYLCAKCNKKIVDRYLLETLDKYWHEDCLKCDACDGRLGELGSKLYFKNNSILCQRDYLRMFRPTGTCAACTKTIPAFEQVMRAGTNVYHLECFACQECNHRFCIGDKFYLDVDHNKILCEYDYEERMVFAQMAYNYNSLAQLKRQISQQVDDFDEVQPVPPR